jgi:hypothetical protein
VSNKPKVFCFVNSGAGTDWQHVIAVAEDGEALAGHVSSSKAFAMHDITSEAKQGRFRAKYPDGCEVVWMDDPCNHPDFPALIEAVKAWNLAHPQPAATEAP